MVDGRMVRFAELEIVPDRLADYLGFLTEEIRTSLDSEPGVLMLQAVSERDAPHRIRLLEVYASAAAYEAHIASPHFLKYKNGTSDMVASLRLLDVDPIALDAE